MSHLLPPNLLKLFAPRPQPPFLRPLTRDERNRGPNAISGLVPLAKRIKEEAEDAEVKLGLETKAAEAAEEEKKLQTLPEEQAAGKSVKPEIVKEDGEDGEVPEETAVPGKKKKKLLREKIKEMGIIGEEAVKMRKVMRKERQEEYKKDAEKSYKPQNDPQAVGDPYKTLFIAHLSKKATETDLRREFEMYGPIERIHIVRNRKGKSNGYAFIVYERERDMKAAYKDAEGIPIHHKKILVDVERGRTVKGWKPHRLGGGLGGRPKPVVVSESAPPAFAPPQGGFRGGRGGSGGFRGGGRGGFGGGDRGGFQGGRGGFQGGGGFQSGGRGGFGGGRGGSQGGDRGGFGGGGGFRGGYQGGGGGGGRGGFQGGQQNGYGGQQGGFGGQQGGFNQGGSGGGFGGGYQQQQNGFQGGGGHQGGGGGGYKRDFDNTGGPGSAGGGGFQGGGGEMGGGYQGGGGGGYQDRDSKRMRY